MTMINTLSMTTAATVAALALAGSASAQPISYISGTYAQNFDGLTNSGFVALSGKGPHAIDGVLGSTGLAGWSCSNFTGSGANTEFRAQDGSLGSSEGRGVISFGVTAAAERALGALPTSNQISGFGAVFVNDSGLTLTKINIAYTGEQWRRGTVPNPNSLTFAYGFGASIADAATTVPALVFISPNMQAEPTEVALDGNDPANQQAISASIDGLAWEPGTTLAIVWKIQDFSGQDNGLAIDGFTLSAEASPAPCYPDCDGDTQLTIDDFICFQTTFALGDPFADCDGDSLLTIDDFICYQTSFAIGC